MLSLHLWKLLFMCRRAVQITHKKPVGWILGKTFNSKIFTICFIMRYVLVRVSLVIREKNFKFLLILIFITRFRCCPYELSPLSRRFSSFYHSSFVLVIFKLNFILKLVLNYKQPAFEITQNALYLSEPYRIINRAPLPSLFLQTDQERHIFGRT